MALRAPNEQSIAGLSTFWQDAGDSKKLDWDKWVQQAPAAAKLTFPRCLRPDPKAQPSLHVFCDASSAASGAAQTQHQTPKPGNANWEPRKVYSTDSVLGPVIREHEENQKRIKQGLPPVSSCRHPQRASAVLPELC